MLFRRLFIFFLSLVIFLPAAGFARTPNDPLVGQWAYTDLGVSRAWDITTGSHEVVVAVIDNGFDSWHPDLIDNVWRNSDEVPDNAIDDDANGYVDDTVGWNFAIEDTNKNGMIDFEEQRGSNDPRPSVFSLNSDIEAEVVHHGTVVAGIIGASGNNGEAGAGVNWNVKLMNIKVVGNTGTGELTRLPEAIRYAVNNGAHVINMSFVGSVDEDVKAAVKYAYERGVAVIAAAGNDLMSLNDVQRYPVCADAGEKEKWVLGVSAINESHRLASFSNIGSDCVDITAPGVGISSTLRFAPGYGLRDLYGGPWQGTSFAAPFVSGAAALMKSIHPEWTAPKIYHALLSTVHKTPPKDEAEYANLYGAGLLQIDKAVAYADAEKRTNPSAAKSGALLSLLQVNRASGTVYTLDAATKDGAARSQPAFKGVDDVAALPADSDRRLVTVKWNGRSAAAVTLVTSAGEAQASWTIPSRGPLDVLAGDVTGSEEKEIIVAPRTPSDVVFRVFSQKGALLREVRAAKRHGGVSLGFVANAANNKQDILALYATGEIFSLVHYGDTFEVKKTIPVSFMKKPGIATSGDIDGDGAVEYIVGAGAGEEPMLAFIGMDGSVLRRFTAFGGEYRGGMTLAAWDYDSDGVEDVVVSPLAGGVPTRVWSGRVKMLAEWWPFGEVGAGGTLVPVYR